MSHTTFTTLLYSVKIMSALLGELVIKFVVHSYVLMFY